MTFIVLFTNYSENAFNQVIEQAPGKPYKDEHNKVLGVIKSAKRYSEVAIEFDVETF